MNHQVMNNISISVFFPCYNEGRNIGKLLTNTLNFIPKICSDFEVIVVDDGSRDDTAEIAHIFSQKDPRVKVVSHGRNKGYGFALRTGIENSNKNYIFFTDGDNQFDITELAKLLPHLQDFDIVAGFRIKRKDNLVRRLNAKSFKILIQILFGLKITDLNCAFKIFKSKSVKNMELKSSGAMINAEILIRAMKKGYKMKEVGINHYPRQWGTQTGGNLRVIIRAFRDLYKMRKELK